MGFSEPSSPSVHMWDVGCGERDRTAQRECESELRAKRNVGNSETNRGANGRCVRRRSLALPWSARPDCQCTHHRRFLSLGRASSRVPHRQPLVSGSFCLPGLGRYSVNIVCCPNLRPKDVEKIQDPGPSGGFLLIFA